MFIIEKPEIIEKQKEIVKYHQLLISTESLLTSSFIAFHAFYFSVSAFVIFSTYHIGFCHCFPVKIYHEKVVGSCLKVTFPEFFFSSSMFVFVCVYFLLL